MRNVDFKKHSAFVREIMRSSMSFKRKSTN